MAHHPLVLDHDFRLREPAQAPASPGLTPPTFVLPFLDDIRWANTIYLPEEARARLMLRAVLMEPR
jgi:hypothetical protein